LLYTLGERRGNEMPPPPPPTGEAYPPSSCKFVDFEDVREECLRDILPLPPPLVLIILFERRLTTGLKSK